MTLHEIESAIAGLPPDELSKFRVWFAEFDAAAWDREFEEDVAAGRLDTLADDALEDFARRQDDRPMRHQASRKFWQHYRRLPSSV